MVKALSTRQKVPGSDSDSGMDFCSGLDSTFSPGFFSPRAKKITEAPATNQPKNHEISFLSQLVKRTFLRRF